MIIPRGEWEPSDDIDEGGVLLDGSGRSVTLAELLAEPKFLAWQDDPNNPDAKHDYTCKELGKLWNWHRDTVERIFTGYKGVIVLQHPETKAKRGYTSIRIPGPVAARWRREHTNHETISIKTRINRRPRSS